NQPRAVSSNIGGGTFDPDPATTLTFSGAITGSGNLTKMNDGTLVLSSASNTYSGGTNLNGGVLTISASANLGDPGAANTLTFNGGTLKTTGNLNSSRAVLISPGVAAIIDTAGSTVTFNGAVSGSGDLTKINAGTLVLSNLANSYSGAIILNAGVVSVSASSHL